MEEQTDIREEESHAGQLFTPWSVVLATILGALAEILGGRFLK